MCNYSFIIPVYNCEKYLEKCVKNIIDIGLTNYEIVLVEDGASDSSALVCDCLSERFKFVKVIHQANQGASAARNRGIREADGEYIIFLDADDSIDSNKMAEFLSKLEEQEADLALFGMSFDYYYKEKCYRSDNLCYSFDGKMSQVQWITELDKLYENNYISPIWNKVFKRKIIEDYCLKFEEKMIIYEDLEFVLRYLSVCNEIYVSSESIYHYRQAEDEGNAGRRLARIESLSDYIKWIENAINDLSLEKDVELQQDTFQKVVLRLYLTIAREKIAVSNVHGIKRICDDMSGWYAAHRKGNANGLTDGEQKYLDRVLKKQIVWLFMNKHYIRIRHQIAIRVKNLIRVKRKLE